MPNLFSHIAPLGQALDFHLERHNLLASNIANVETPNFKPKDLARIGDPQFAQVMQIAMQKTQAGHLGVGNNEPMVGKAFDDLSAGGGADGNFVSLDREAGKLAANRLRYDVVSVIVKSQLSGMLRAASDGKGG